MREWFPLQESSGLYILYNMRNVKTCQKAYKSKAIGQLICGHQSALYFALLWVAVWAWLWWFPSNEYVKRGGTQLLSAYGPLWKWQPVANGACRSEGMHQMVKSCYTNVIRPSKPIVFCLFRLQREYRSAWGRCRKKNYYHTVKCCSLPKGSGWLGFIADAYSKTLSWILQKHVHLHKQAMSAKCPSWGSAKMCGVLCFVFFCSW